MHSTFRRTDITCRILNGHYLQCDTKAQSYSDILLSKIKALVTKLQKEYITQTEGDSNVNITLGLFVFIFHDLAL